MYYANQTIKGEQNIETVFDFADGVQTSDSKLEYKGKVYNGKLILHANGEVAVCIDDKEHYAYKNKDIDEVISGIGTCLYDGTTGDFSSNSSINDLRGKTVVATNVTQSEDGLSTLITIPEEGHYDETSQISVSNSDLGGNYDIVESVIKGDYQSSSINCIVGRYYLLVNNYGSSCKISSGATIISTLSDSDGPTIFKATSSTVTLTSAMNQNTIVLFKEDFIPKKIISTTPIFYKTNSSEVAIGKKYFIQTSWFGDDAASPGYPVQVKEISYSNNGTYGISGKGLSDDSSMIMYGHASARITIIE